MWQIGFALGLLTIGAALLRERCILGVAATLLVNWMINTAWVRLSGDAEPWPFFIGADYISGMFAVAGVALICKRFTWGGAIVGLLYVAAIMAHIAYGMSDHGAWAKYRYWYTTYYLLIAQMVAVFTWGVCDLARRALRASRGLPPRQRLAEGHSTTPSRTEP